MKTDIEIARETKLRPITKIAKKLGLRQKDLIMYGENKAKIKKEIKNPKGKLILVTAINPTKAGIGKTTVSIGLADALALKKQKVCLALREPSLGPVFGIKGGATGGGYSQIVPMEDINLHFNGDFHAITSANNLLCSLIDNHIFQGNLLNLDPKKILFNRCLDLNDRALRNVEIIADNYTRTDKFSITSASEIMAIMCLAENIEDLKTRLGNILVGFTTENKPIYAKDLKAENSMAILLKDAMRPNLVQTLAGTPAIVHCGPFANIAHGCNSITATKTAMSLANYCITEAGFGADLGAQKFLDFKCHIGNLKPNCVVLVATIKALKLHGGAEESTLSKEDLSALKKGSENLLAHINTIKNVYHLPLIVTLNKYVSDTEKEIELVKSIVPEDTKLVINNVWAEGGKGALELADEVIDSCQISNEDFSYSYNQDDSVEKKMKNIVKKVYGGLDIELEDKAKESLALIKKLKMTKLPVIMAKTQFSLSADAKFVGAPKDFKVTIKDIEIRSGAGFLVAICGNILLMPGLSKSPAATKMTIDNNGKIDGLF